MKKTLNINLGGIVFNIEEDAYDKLRHYFDSIKKHFAAYPDCDEIVKDIESRSAEKFSEKISPSKQVITIEDTEELIKSMGQVSDIAGEEEKETEDEQEPAPRSRKLFRDPDDMIIAGVCSGLAAYLSIEPILIRLAFIASIFFGGAGILIYLVLWLIMPEAKTASKQLEMQGYAVTLSGIEKAIKEKVASYPERHNDENRFTRLIMLPFRISGKIFNTLIKVFKKIVPIFSVIIGASISAGAIAAIVGICFVFSGLAMNYFSSYTDVPLNEIFAGKDFYIALATGFLAGFIPIFFALTLGLSLIRRKWIFGMITSLVFVGIWVVSVSVFAGVSVKAVPVVQALVNKAENAPEISQNFDLTGFSKIKADGWDKIKIIKGDEFSITATGTAETLKQAELKVKDGELVIDRRQKNGICFMCIGNNKEIRYEITMPVLESVKADRMDEFDISGFEQKTMELDLGGFAEVRLNGKIDELSLIMNGGPKAYLEGSGISLSADMSENPYLESFKYEAKNVILYASGESSARVWATEKLNIQGTPWGKIYYKGEPQVSHTDEFMPRKMLKMDVPGTIEFKEFEPSQPAVAY